MPGSVPVRVTMRARVCVCVCVCACQVCAVPGVRLSGCVCVRVGLSGFGPLKVCVCGFPAHVSESAAGRTMSVAGISLAFLDSPAQFSTLSTMTWVIERSNFLAIMIGVSLS